MAHNGRQKADDAILMALACGATVENAARTAGVAPRTVHRRLTDPGFSQRLHAIRADMVQRTAGMLTGASMEAVKILLELLKPTNPASVRLGAARAILENGMKVREKAELEDRLVALEKQAVLDKSRQAS
jgi:hypothetical protein